MANEATTNDELATVDHLLSTTRSVRLRLDLERSVPTALIEESINIALQAPTGGELPDMAIRRRDRCRSARQGRRVLPQRVRKIPGR